jgi:hypothetical protein
MENYAEFRFYEELNDFLPSARRKVAFTHYFKAHPSIKDTIEALGVPHTEVDLVLVNGHPVSFAYQLQHLDKVSVYPVFESFDITTTSLVRAQPLRVIKFILDVHLGRLAKYLRLLGFDTSYANNFHDNQLVQLALAEKRIILTRDIGVLKHKLVTHGYWLREIQPKKQLLEVIKRFDLINLIKPFQRCLVCNGELQAVAKQTIEHQLAANTMMHYQDFLQCQHCQKIYWQGSHYQHMMKLLAEIKEDD